MTAAELDLFIEFEPERDGGAPHRLHLERQEQTPTFTPADVFNLAYDSIHPDPTQPRVDADAELRASIALSGLHQPISVRPISPAALARGLDAFSACEHCGRAWGEIAGSGEDFMIADGERRWRASAGVLANLPAIVRRDIDERSDRLLMQLEANTGKPLTPLEEARAFLEIISTRGMSQSMLAARLGRKRSSITDRLALLKNTAWVPLLESGEITSSQMVELSRYSDEPAERHADAIRCMRDLAGEEIIGDDRGAKPIASIEIARFRHALATFAYPVEEATSASSEQTSISDVEQLAGEAAAAATSDVPGFVDVEQAIGTASNADQDEHQNDAAPAHHEDDAASSPRGTAPAGLEDPPRERKASPAEIGWNDGESASELPVAAASAPSSYGLFQQLAPLLGERPATIMIGPSKLAGSYRVTIVPAAGKKGENAALTVPLSVDGTPEELDTELPAAVAQYLLRRGTIGESVAAAAQKMADQATKRLAKSSAGTVEKIVNKANTAAKRGGSKPAAKKTSKPAPAKKLAPAKTKSVKPARRRSAKKARKAKVELRPDAALAAVIGDATGIKLPAAIKGVQAYVREQKLQGAGALRGVVSCDDKLRALFDAPVVKLNQLAKLVKPHLVVALPDPADAEASGATVSDASSTPPLDLTTPDPAQIDWTIWTMQQPQATQPQETSDDVAHGQ